MKKYTYTIFLLLLFSVALMGQNWPRFYWNQIQQSTGYGQVAIAGYDSTGRWTDTLLLVPGPFMKIVDDTLATRAYARTAASDTNLGNTDISLTDTRVHDIGTHELGFSTDANSNTLNIDGTSGSIGVNGSFDPTYTLSVNGDLYSDTYSTEGTSSMKISFHQGKSYGGTGAMVVNTGINYTGASYFILRGGYYHYVSNGGTYVGTWEAGGFYDGTRILNPSCSVHGNFRLSSKVRFALDGSNNIVVIFGETTDAQSVIFFVSSVELTKQITPTPISLSISRETDISSYSIEKTITNVKVSNRVPFVVSNNASSGITNNVIKLMNRSGAANDKVGLMLSASGGDFDDETEERGIIIEAEQNSAGAEDLVIKTPSANSQTATPVERFRIDWSGNIGLSNALPAYSLDFGTSDAVKLPGGTTAQRPTSIEGLLRYNSDSLGLEAYVDAAWRRVNTMWLTNGNYIGFGDRTGIGTFSPDRLFHIKSSESVGRIESTGSGGSESIWEVWATNAGTLGNALTHYKKGSTNWYAGIYKNNDDYYGIGIDNGSTIPAFTASTTGVGIKVSPSSSARINITGGSTTIAPIQFNSGTLLTIPLAGSFEYDGDSLYLTDSGATRRSLAFAGDAQDGDGIYGGSGSLSGNTTVTAASNDFTISTTGDANTLDIDGATGNIGIQATPGNDAELTIGGTNAIEVPRGTTAQQPGAANEGMIRANSTKKAIEGFEDDEWRPHEQTDDIVTTATTSTIVVYKNSFIVADLLSSGQTITLDPTDLATGSKVTVMVTNSNNCTLDSDTGNFISTTANTTTKSLTEGAYLCIWSGANWYFITLQ